MLCCCCLVVRSVVALLLPIVAGGFVCPCHLCLCAHTSWRWLLSSFCPTLRCKDLLQSFPRTLPLDLTQRRVLEEVLKGPRRILSSVDLSSDAVNHHRKEMKGLLEYWKNTLSPCIVCIVHIISTYFWPFDRLLFSCQYQFNTSDSGCVRHKGFCFTHPIIRTKMEL